MLLKVWRRLGHKNETRIKVNRAGIEIPLVTTCSADGKYLSKYSFLKYLDAFSGNQFALW